MPARLSYPGIRSVTHYPRLSITDYPLTSVGVEPRRPFRSVPFRSVPFRSVPSAASRVRFRSEFRLCVSCRARVGGTH